MIPDREFAKDANRNQFVQGHISGVRDTAALLVCRDGTVVDRNRYAMLVSLAVWLEKWLFGLQGIALGKERMPAWNLKVIDAMMVEFEQQTKPPETAAVGVGENTAGATDGRAA